MASKKPKGAVKELAEIDVEKVISSAALAGKKVFKELEDELLGIRQVASRLIEVDWEKAPQVSASRMGEQCSRLHQRVLELENFRGVGGNAESVMNNFRNSYAEVFSQAPLFLALESSSENLRQQSALILSDLEDREQEAQEILQSLQKPAGLGAVVNYSTFLKRKRRTASRRRGGGWVPRQSQASSLFFSLY